MERCPEEDYTPLGNAKLGIQRESFIKSRMKPFCSPFLTEEDLRQFSVKELVKRKLCPPWLVSIIMKHN